MRADNFIVIQGWMRTKLNLCGNDLIVYAVIYGFCQIDNQKYTGSIQYLADWCGATRQGITKNLNNLINKGLITKEVNGNSISYCVNSVDSDVNSVYTPCKLSLHNNIDNKKEDNIGTSKEVDWFDLEEKPKKRKKQDKYHKCKDYIMQYTNSPILQDVLDRYLLLLLEKEKDKDKPFQFFANQWPSIVNELDNLAKNTNDMVAIVNQSILYRWNKFYPLKSNKSNVKNHPTERNVVSDKKTDAELDLADEVY